MPFKYAALDDPTYTVGQWAGLDNYECDNCKFKTLEFPAMENHLDEHRLGNIGPRTPESMAAERRRQKELRRLLEDD